MQSKSFPVVLKENNNFRYIAVKLHEN